MRVLFACVAWSSGTDCVFVFSTQSRQRRGKNGAGDENQQTALGGVVKLVFLDMWGEVRSSDNSVGAGCLLRQTVFMTHLLFLASHFLTVHCQLCQRSCYS